MAAARLIDVARATPRTRLLRLDLAGERFTFRAGQAAFVGVAGSGLQAAYSIASPPALAATGRLELLVPFEGAFGQPGLDPEAVVGAALDVDGPIGTFGVPDHVDDVPLLLVAGGTGIAPLRSIVQDQLGREGTPPLTLVYSVRTPDEFAFADELVALEADGRLSLFATVTRDVPGADGGRLGRVDEALLREALPTPSACCLVCGPTSFVQAITTALGRLGVAPERLVVER